MQGAAQRVGEAVRRLRRERGWTQVVLAHKAGVDPAHLGEIERGQINITLRTLQTLADTLKVTICDLLCSDGHRRG